MNVGEQPAAMQTSNAPMHIMDNNNYNRFVVLVLSLCTTVAVTWSYLIISLQITFNLHLRMERDLSSGRCNGVTAKIQQRTRQQIRIVEDFNRLEKQSNPMYYTYICHGSKLQQQRSCNRNDVISINEETQASRIDCEGVHS